MPRSQRLDLEMTTNYIRRVTRATCVHDVLTAIYLSRNNQNAALMSCFNTQKELPRKARDNQQDLFLALNNLLLVLRCKMTFGDTFSEKMSLMRRKICKISQYITCL